MTTNRVAKYKVTGEGESYHFIYIQILKEPNPLNVEFVHVKMSEKYDIDSSETNPPIYESCVMQIPIPEWDKMMRDLGYVKK